MAGVRCVPAVPVWLAEDDLGCAICHELLKSPTTLPCGHSFCRGCLEALWRATGASSCPTCREPCPPPRELRRNLLLQELADKYGRAVRELDRPPPPREPQPAPEEPPRLVAQKSDSTVGLKLTELVEQLVDIARNIQRETQLLPTGPENEQSLLDMTPLQLAVLPLKAPPPDTDKRILKEKEERPPLRAPPTKIYPERTDFLLFDDPQPYQDRNSGERVREEAQPPVSPPLSPLSSSGLSLPPTPETLETDLESAGAGEGPAMGTPSRARASAEVARTLLLRASGSTLPEVIRAVPLRSAEPVSPEAAKAVPLRAYGSPIPDGQGGQIPAVQYWPFSFFDLYNWKANHPSFSEDPTKFMGLMESLMNTHQPTWDDCQQLLGTLFTTEEQDRIIAEARKQVFGPDGRPTNRPHLLDENCPLTRPNWDYNTPAGREKLSNYRQILMRGLQGAARKPTNLVKVKEVIQGPNESPSLFLERLMEAYRQYTPFDPMAQELQASVIRAFIGQSAVDIRRKLQQLEGLHEMTLKDLVKEAEKVFHNRETPEEREERLVREKEAREDRRAKRRNKDLVKILALALENRQQSNGARILGQKKSRLEKHQCMLASAALILKNWNDTEKISMAPAQG